MEITVAKTEQINLKDLTKEVEEFIFSDDFDDSYPLEDIVYKVIDENYFDFDSYNDEIYEIDKILTYVEEHLNSEALEKLDN